MSDIRLRETVRGIIEAEWQIWLLLGAAVLAHFGLFAIVAALLGEL